MDAYTIDQIGGISTLDSAATLRAMQSAAQDADELDAERQARREHLTAQLQEVIAQGDAWATCHFAGTRMVRSEGGYETVRENLGHVLGDSLDILPSLSFHDVAEYMLNRAKEGDQYAAYLLKCMAVAWVESQL